MFLFFSLVDAQGLSFTHNCFLNSLPEHFHLYFCFANQIYGPDFLCLSVILASSKKFILIYSIFCWSYLFFTSNSSDRYLNSVHMYLPPISQNMKPRNYLRNLVSFLFQTSHNKLLFDTLNIYWYRFREIIQKVEFHQWYCRSFKHYAGNSSLLSTSLHHWVWTTNKFPKYMLFPTVPKHSSST